MAIEYLNGRGIQHYFDNLLRNTQFCNIIDKSLCMNDCVWHAFQDDQQFVTQRQNFFGKRLYAQSKIKNDKRAKRPVASPESHNWQFD